MILRQGARGDAVKALQQKLHPYQPGLQTDGIFGPLTERAVRFYQRRQGLYPADGIVGPITNAALSADKDTGADRAPRPPARRPDGLGKPVSDAADRARHRPMPSGGAMAVARMQVSRLGRKFIFDHEAQRGKSNRLHHPSTGSGVTIGPGYDMKDRSSATVQRDLETIEVPVAIARTASFGAGKSGSAAAEFVRNNKNLIDLTDVQQQGLLAHIVPQYENLVKRSIKVPLHQHEFDALVSYAYNPGGGWRKTTTFVNEGRVHDAMLEIKRHVYSRGELIRSLVTRRAAEAALFLYGEYK
jgi:GH24 family phage-related lysozyme (muramidase)